MLAFVILFFMICSLIEYLSLFYLFDLDSLEFDIVILCLYSATYFVQALLLIENPQDHR
jgi:hypothetical protein